MGETADYIDANIGYAQCNACGWIADETADCYLPDKCPECGSRDIDIWLEGEEW